MMPLKYNFRSLFLRKGNTLMTIGSIAFVVLVYIGVLALAGGLASTFASTGDPATVLVLRDGARSEMESYFSTENHRILASLPGVLDAPSGQPMASGETIVLQILERKDGTESNVMLRGVDEEAFELRPEIEVIEGRTFKPGVGEVIVGRQLSERYKGLDLGDQIEFGRSEFRVVGLFDGDGGAYSSEVWGSITDFASAFRRENAVSSTRLRAASPSAAKDLIASAEADPRLRVDAMTEDEYFRLQGEQSSQIFVILGNGLAALMAFGACFAAANTMYAQVASRGKEIATLRALGFKRRSILGGFLLEAVLLGLIAGGVGALLSLPLNGFSAATMNQATFSDLTFQLRTTPAALFSGIFLATFTGVLGGVWPAISGARRPIAMLLRQA